MLDVGAEYRQMTRYRSMQGKRLSIGHSSNLTATLTPVAGSFEPVGLGPAVDAASRETMS